MARQHYMTEKERYQLEAYLRAGKAVAWIARELGFCRQTIYNEIKRGQYHRIVDRHGYYQDETWYSADKGQQITMRRQRNKGRPVKVTRGSDHWRFLEARLIGEQADGRIKKKTRCSPAAALELARREGFPAICVNTLYNYIHQGGMGRARGCNLWEAPYRKKAKKQENRTAHPQLPSIADRPEHINQRLESGHWEMDLVMGRAKTHQCLMTLYERKSRQELIFKLPDKRAASVRTVFDRLERSMGKHAFREKFKSITTDNGSEFLEYDQLIRSVYGGQRFRVYYCHPYSAWEKGGNENHNRIIRRWFPKGTDFSKVSEKQITELQDWMNGYPRKGLGWKAPAELAV